MDLGTCKYMYMYTCSITSTWREAHQFCLPQLDCLHIHVPFLLRTVLELFATTCTYNSWELRQQFPVSPYSVYTILAPEFPLCTRFTSRVSHPQQCYHTVYMYMYMEDALYYRLLTLTRYMYTVVTLSPYNVKFVFSSVKHRLKRPTGLAET